MQSLSGKVAFITGASRGIGRAIAERLAREGVHCVIASKTVAPHPKLEGTIGEVAEACSALGAEAMAVPVDVRRPHEIARAVDDAVARFGRLDIAIHNAGALWWKPIKDTPLDNFDLVHEVNARGAYALAHAALPHLRASRGHFIAMSPPVEPESLNGTLAGKTAYMMSKLGMTMVAMGVSLEEPAIAANGLWPETLVESAATRNFGIGSPDLWYKAELMAEAVFELVRLPEGERPRGQGLLMLEFMRTRGYTDFTPWRCNPAVEPPSLLMTSKVRAGGKERADGAELGRT